jgi:hypothetical protein
LKLLEKSPIIWYERIEVWQKTALFGLAHLGFCLNFVWRTLCAEKQYVCIYNFTLFFDILRVAPAAASSSAAAVSIRARAGNSAPPAGKR